MRSVATAYSAVSRCAGQISGSSGSNSVESTNNLYKGSQTFSSFRTASMRLPKILPLLLFWAKFSHALSPDFCTNVCSVSTTLCWLCTAVHGAPEEPEKPNNEIEDLSKILKPISKADLIRKAIQAYSSRQQKIVGGKPVDPGESPWTVR